MKLEHILKTRDFSDIIKNGKKYKGKSLCLYIKEHVPIKNIAVGVIISKKTAARAVTRNYLKRVIYAFYTDNSEKINTGVNIVLRVISPVEKRKRKSAARHVRLELGELTKRAKLYNG